MKLPARLLGATALTTIAFAPPAIADVTPDDVWQNMKAYIDAFGGTTTVDVTADGDALNIGEMTMSWNLPFGVGSVAIVQPGYGLAPVGDGTVAVRYPEALSYQLQVSLPDVEFSGALNVTHDGLATTASGDPGNITYSYSAGQIGFELADVVVTDVPDFPFEMSGEVRDLTGTSNVAVTSVISVTSDFRAGTQTFSGTISDPSGFLSEFTGGADSMTSVSEMVLPKSGTDIMNLAAAMEKGFKLSGSSSLSGYKTTQTVSMGDEVMSNQVSVVAQNDVSFSLAKDGLMIDSTALGQSGEVMMAGILPLPITFEIAKASGRLAIPVSASDEIQDAEMSFDINGLAISEQLWGLVDPGQTLPRDPAVMRVNLTGDVKVFWDLFNFMDVAQRGQSGEMPGELHALTLHDLALSIAGAELTGNGAATFDNTDLITFGGMPKPAGKLDLTLKGANTLIDNLIALGLLPEQEAMGARMMMGMVAQPDPSAGDDVLKSSFELTEDGQLLANGVRLQ